MIDADLEMSPAQLRRYIKGPDFPTGGQIINTPDELKEIYETGSGHDPHPRDVAEGPRHARAARRSTSRACPTR